MIRYLLIILLFTGCFTENRARKQFAKAAVAYPAIPAAYCANEFPVKDSTVRDTVTTTDTIIIFEQDIFSDTVIVNDTVRITTVKTLPGRVITNTIHITDTIIRENTAALKACEIDKSKLITLTETQAADIKKYKRKANTRGYIMWGLLLLIALVFGANIWWKAKKITFK